MISEGDAAWLRDEFDDCIEQWRATLEDIGPFTIATWRAFERVCEAHRIITGLGVLEVEQANALMQAVDPHVDLRSLDDDE
jgi:hypothetical protein